MVCLEIAGRDRRTYSILSHAFGEGAYKGKVFSLTVDTPSSTGATRLYERAGMHITRRYDIYEKELRVGVELRTQALAE